MPLDPLFFRELNSPDSQDRASPKSLHALTARAFGAYREREVQAVGTAHSLHLPLLNGSLASRLYKKTTFEKP